MKKKAWIILIASFVIITTVGILGYKSIGRRPYKDLDAVDIVSASVELLPPDETVEIVEIKELVEYLKDVVIYKQDDSWREYTGQATVFTLTMADGTIEEVTAYNPFVIINGTGYRTKYEPCEKLNSYANRLLHEKQEEVAEKATIISFSYTFDTNGISSYDSSTGKLVKTSHATHPEDYITTMVLNGEEWQEVTELLGSLDMLNYPDSYDPINAPDAEQEIMSAPDRTLILTVNTDRWTKTVSCRNIAFINEGYDDMAQQFLDVCERLRKIITSSEEWEALPDYEFFYE